MASCHASLEHTPPRKRKKKGSSAIEIEKDTISSQQGQQRWPHHLEPTLSKCSVAQGHNIVFSHCPNQTTLYNTLLKEGKVPPLKHPGKTNKDAINPCTMLIMLETPHPRAPPLGHFFSAERSLRAGSKRAVLPAPVTLNARGESLTRFDTV